MRKLLTRNILLVSFVSFFNDIASEMLYPVTPVYLRSIGFSIVLIGLLEGIAEFTAGISKGYFGNLSDRKGTRLPFVQLGYTLSAISKPMMALFTFPWWVFIARTTDRLGKGVRTSARDALLSDETTPENKGKVFGFHRMFDTLGASIGPFLALGFLLIYPGEYKWLFYLAFLPGILSILITLFIRENCKTNKTKDAKVLSTPFFGYLHYWKEANRSYKLLVVGLLAFAFFNSSDIFLLLTLKNNGMNDSQMIGFYIFYNLIFALFSLPIGYLADKIGLKTTLIIGLLLFAIVYTSFGFAQSVVSFAIIFFIYGLFAAANEGVAKALISNLAQKDKTATAIGFFNSFSSVCAMLASVTGGILFVISPKLMFWVSGFGVFAVVLFFMIVKFWKDELQTA
jgi:MFS family permease